MTKIELPLGSLEILLKEHALLRDEIKERLKTAFSHVAYVGAIVAFALPASGKISDGYSTLALILAAVGAFVLGWIAFLNMRWVQHCGAYVKHIEDRVNLHFGHKVLGWEAYASDVQRKLWFLLPPDPREFKSKHLQLHVQDQSSAAYAAQPSVPGDAPQAAHP